MAAKTSPSFEFANKFALRLSFDILAEINEARNSHGLRHQDYQRYRHYCTGRVRRLRKLLHLSQQTGKNYVSKPITAEMVTSVKHLQVLLFDCERAWSYAMEIREQAVEEDEPRKRHHQVKRIRKAAKIAESLAEIAKLDELVDARTHLDMIAYASWMRAMLLLQQENYELALEKFALSMHIYECLGSTGTQQQQALCQATMDEIDAQIRYCAYQLRIGGNKDPEGLIKKMMKMASENEKVSELAQKLDVFICHDDRQEKMTILTSVTWRGQQIPLKSAELAVALLKVQDAQNSLKSSFEVGIMNNFDSVLSAYGEASLISRRLVEDNKIASAKVKTTKTEINAADLRLVDDYITYHYICKRIERNVILAAWFISQVPQFKDKLVSHYANFIKLFDSVLQSLVEMKGLDTVQDDSMFAQEIDGVEFHFKGVRCMFLAETYAHVGQIREALALFDRAKGYLTQARSILSVRVATDELPGNVTLEQVQNFEGMVRGKKSETHATWYLKVNDENNISEKLGNMSIEKDSSPDEKDRPLIERLNEFPERLSMEQPNIVKIPPRMKLITPRPFFIDVAINHINYPEELQAKVGKTSSKGTNNRKEKGESGWLGSLWGRK